MEEISARSHALERDLHIQHLNILLQPMMIRILDSKTQEILDWTLLRLITVTFQQRSVFHFLLFTSACENC